MRGRRQGASRSSSLSSILIIVSFARLFTLTRGRVGKVAFVKNMVRGIQKFSDSLVGRRLGRAGLKMRGQALSR